MSDKSRRARGDRDLRPFLIQIGFLDRTLRGRVATRLVYEHFGIPLGGKRANTLF